MEEIDKEKIPDTDFIFRVVHQDQTKLEGLSKLPTPKAFERHPKNDIDGLSVNWEKYTSATETLAITGATYRTGKTEFKDPEKFEVYKLNAGIVHKLKEQVDVIYDPKFYGDPHPKGKPNNPGHSLITYPMTDDPEMKVKLRTHAISLGKCEIDKAQLEELLKKFRNP